MLASKVLVVLAFDGSHVAQLGDFPRLFLVYTAADLSHVAQDALEVQCRWTQISSLHIYRLFSKIRNILENMSVQRTDVKMLTTAPLMTLTRLGNKVGTVLVPKFGELDRILISHIVYNGHNIPQIVDQHARIFGASNVTKILQDLPESSRADAVTSLAFEAEARMKDPVYGCSGAISLTQTRILELQEEVQELLDQVNYLEDKKRKRLTQGSSGTPNPSTVVNDG
ncbi:hypothetical protein AXG93_4858s1000 [Marchantia polymorpha subsp. ruderalis]|uniref:LOB domain-containing protein n=1 Tax=Marchantia polymorpha subsp. ruderalis TaxID=1480154 RepID=A0A176WQB5_MARPO|nr:hypothetical protein AXG93_4858s1000 [Marchantia polymorpha subsp. ruderalis]